jgi:hypothetical protein
MSTRQYCVAMALVVAMALRVIETSFDEFVGGRAMADF